MQVEKGKKRIKDEPVLHNEVKKDHHIFITPSSWNKLKDLASKKGVSVSEFIELWVRNIDGD